MSTNLNCARMVEELVPKVVDGEALDWQVEAVDVHLRGCADCTAWRDELVRGGSVLREDARAAVAAADFSGVWAAVSRGMDRADADARVQRIKGGFFGWSGFSRFAAAAAMAAAFAWAMLVPPGHLEHDFARGDNRVEVSSVEGGDDNTVMVYESQDENVTFIWVMDETWDERAL